MAGFRAKLAARLTRNILVPALAMGFLASAVQARAQAPVAAAMPGTPQLSLGVYDIAGLGYTVDEFELAGSASSYRLIGERGPDGDWKAERDGAAAYRTRIVVIRPRDAGHFNGTVIVEWLNVSGGLDVPVDWVTLHREMVRKGYAYVAVSAQQVGVEGGPNLGRGSAAPLKTSNPARYGHLAHPGDAFSFDIYTDVARLLRGRQRKLVLGDLRPRRLIAVGESQSAFFLTTYVNAVDPLVRKYDGFLIHSRSGVAAPLDGSAFVGGPPELMQAPVRLRRDLRVPTMQVHTETDVFGLVGSIGFHAARQPDTDRLRTWEIAGSAHADNYLFKVGMIDSGALAIEQLAAAWQPADNLQGLKLPVAMNNGPQHHYVVQAALDHLVTWVRDGKAPPTFAPLELTSASPPAFATDEHGIARGGVRTPWVDVPVAVLSGLGAAPMMPLVGSSRPFDEATLKSLYPRGRDAYLSQFGASLDRAIASGIILPADRDEILALARLGFPGKE